jgi:uncharacterized protein (TIGR02996 family)
MLEQLFEQIDKTPEDADTYLVLSDFLQASGDPRGELIALQHAHVLDPANDQVQAQVERLLRQHRDAWLGPLARLEEAELTLTWELGFVSGARLSRPTVDQTVTALRQLLELESARFLRRLSVRAQRASLDYQPVWDVLLELERPVTLAELRVGEAGRARVPAEIWATFPRLGDPPETVWSAITDRIAKQKRLKSGFEGADLHKLALQELDLGEVIKVETDPLLVGLRAETDKKRDIGLLSALPRLFTADSLDGFAESLLAQWERVGMDSQRRWVMAVVGALGGDRCARYLGQRLQRWSHQRSVQAAELLVQIGSPMGINAVYELTAAYGSRAEQAAEILGRMAKNRGVAPDGVLDRAVPRQLSKQERKWFLRLQRRWLEELMINGHRLTASDFKHYVAAGPRRSLAARLVWGAFRDGELKTFVIGQDDSTPFFDEEDAAVTLDGSDVKVGLVHPYELSRAVKRRWWERFTERKVEQPFLQLRRPVLKLTASEAGRKTLYRFASRVVHNPEQFAYEGRWKAWESYDMERDHFLYGYELSLGRGGRRLEAVAVEEQSLIQRVFNRGRRPFGDYHPVLLSELLLDLEAATSLPVEGKFPRVELDPGRGATCVVCQKKVAPGTVRVGVQRDLIIEEKRERRTVWVHWGCVPFSPELQLAGRTRDIGRELAEARAELGPVPDEPEPTQEEEAQAPQATPSVELTEEQVLALCPDEKAVAATKKVAKPSQWTGLGCDHESVWGQAKGSSTYNVSARLDEPGRGLHCDCPSRKRPCKHAVALLLLFVRKQVLPAK